MIDLDRFWSGDRPYFGEIVRAQGPSVMRTARRLSSDQDEADDLYQEVWIHAYEHRRSYTGRGEPGAWLHRVTLNVCRMKERKRQARDRALKRMIREGVFEESSWTPLNPSSQVERAERLSRLHEALAHLTEREREAIDLRFIQNMSYKEIAEAMGIEIPTARSLVRNGKKRLSAFRKGSRNGLS